MAPMKPKGRRPSARTGASRSTSGIRPTTIMLGFVTLCMAAGGVGFVGWREASEVPIDAGTSCPVTGPIAVHAVLIDRSDAITPLQAQRLDQLVNQIVNDADIGERIDLYVLNNGSGQSVSPALSLCRPKSEGSIWTENPKRIKARYVSRFRRPLDNALALLSVPASSKTSPIMESIKAVCVAAFGGMAPGVPTRLTIASDMIQYSPILDQYKQRDFAAFSRTAGYKEVITDCHRAKVDVLYFVRARDGRVQDREHELFWEKYFDHVDATLVRLEPI